MYVYFNICLYVGWWLDWVLGKFLISKGVLICVVYGVSFVVFIGWCIGGLCCG